MKKIEGFTMRRLGQEAMIVAESVELIDFDRIVSLNPSAAYVWESLPDTEFTSESIAGFLSQKYDVEEYIARKDAEELTLTWLKAGIIEE